MTRYIATALALLLWVPGIFAQKKPKESASVWLGFHASVRAAVKYGIGIDSSVPNDLTFREDYTNFAGNDTPVNSPEVLVQVVPGRLYTIGIGSENWRDADFQFNVPAGYTLYMGQLGFPRTPHTTFRTQDFAGGLGTFLMVFELRPNDAAASLLPGYSLPPSIGDVVWAISMGRVSDGTSAGVVRWRSPVLSDALLDPTALIYAEPFTDEVATTYYDDGALRYISTLAVQLYVRRGAAPKSGYVLEVYHPYATHTGDTDWTFSEQPYLEYNVHNPDSSWNNRVAITRTQRDNGTTVDTWTLSVSGSTTLLDRQESLRLTRIVSDHDPVTGDRREVVTVEDSAGVVASKLSRTYHGYVWGEELIKEVADPDGLALTTTYDYYDDGWVSHAFSGSVTKLKSVSRPDGSWEKYEYYEDFARWGQLKAVYRPWQTSPASPSLASSTNCQVTYMNYAAERNIFQELSAGTETKINGITTAKTVVTPTVTTWGYYNVSPINEQPIRLETIQNYWRSDQPPVTTTRIVFHNTADPDYNGRLVSQNNPDGTRVAASYVKGNFLDYSRLDSAWQATRFEPNPAGTYWCETYLYGLTSASAPGAVLISDDGMVNGRLIDPLYMVPNKSVRRQLIYNNYGQQIFDLTQVYTGSDYQIVGWQHQDFLVEGLVVGKKDIHANTWTGSYIAGQLNFQNNPDGTKTQYFFDDLRRVEHVESKGIDAAGAYAAQDSIFTYYTYDAAGRVLTTRTTAGGHTQSTSTKYNLAGLPTSSVDAQGLTTTYDYANGGRVVTTTAPGGATQIVETNIDGSVKSTTGTAVIPSYSHRDILDSSSESGFLVSTITVGTDGGPRYSRTISDWLGRPIREQRPAFGGGTYVKSYYYDDAGRLARTSEPGVADTLYVYNAFGEIYMTGLDVDGNGRLDENSVDRINRSESKYVYQDGAWWSQALSYSYNQANGTPQLMGETLSKLTGYEYSGSDYDNGVAKIEARSYDLFRNLTISRSVYDLPQRLVTTTTQVPDSTANVISVARNGRLQTSQTAQNLVYSYGYDSFGRLIETIDPRTGSSKQGYYDETAQVGSRHKLAWTEDAAQKRTSYAYSSDTGRPYSVTDARLRTSYTNYNIRGQVVQSWGATTYPVEYGYDSFGTQTTMKTFRDASVDWTGSVWPTNSGTGDSTTWRYEDATGLLLGKMDAKNHEVTYSYTSRGQLQTRTWARNVITTYGYDPATGEQKTVTYSDGSTANLAYSYDRRGMMSSVSDSTDTRTFEHCDCGKVTAEYLSAFYESRQLHSYLDQSSAGTKGRITSMSVLTSAGGSEYSVNYGYDSYGRLNGVGGFTYQFTSNSNLIKEVDDSNSGWKQLRGYDPQRDLQASVETDFGSTVEAKFVYTHDDLGRRISNAQSGALFASYTGGGLETSWDYNDRSEVTNSKTKFAGTTIDVGGRSYVYNYDNIGNRTSSSVDGTTTTYSPNELNQYNSRTVPAQYSVAGLASGTATVMVNGTVATRNGDYFYLAQSSASNSSGAVWEKDVVTSSLGGVSTRTSFIPQSPESYTYDADGNLLTDGRWQYTWDAENRLAAMETLGGAYVAGAPRQRLEFQYDYLGRRVLKRTLNWSSPGWSLASERRFLYDGWNVLEEFNTANKGGAFALANQHVWGIDLSGKLQDAGGVGGLLVTYNFETGTPVTMLPAYDGNGNVHAMIDPNRSGALVAQFEYSAFGETLRATGTMAGKVNFRFSTKYTDQETQFLYYGFRYYNPELGRFLGRDPTEEKGGLHLYAFVGNNGVNRWDYLGQHYQSGYETEDMSDWDADDYARWNDDRAAAGYASAMQEQMRPDELDHDLRSDMHANPFGNIGLSSEIYAPSISANDAFFMYGNAPLPGTQISVNSATGELAGSPSDGKTGTVTLGTPTVLGTDDPIESTAVSPTDVVAQNDSGLLTGQALQDVVMSGPMLAYDGGRTGGGLEPCIRCHGVDAGGFHGNVNDFRGLGQLTGSARSAVAFENFANSLASEGPQLTFELFAAGLSIAPAVTSLLAAESAGVRLSEKGLSLVENHLATFGDDAANAAMVGRLRTAFANGEKVIGADANFYLHEASEATMMARGMGYDAAHAAALEKYGVSNFSLYHPEVIQANPGLFNNNWFNFWNLPPKP